MRAFTMAAAARTGSWMRSKKGPEVKLWNHPYSCFLNILVISSYQLRSGGLRPDECASYAFKTKTFLQEFSEVLYSWKSKDGTPSLKRPPLRSIGHPCTLWSPLLWHPTSINQLNTATSQSGGYFGGERGTNRGKRRKINIGSRSTNARPCAPNLPPPSISNFWVLFSCWISVSRGRWDHKHTACKSAHSECVYLQPISDMFLCP